MSFQLKEIDIEMDDPDATIFKYVQQLIKPFPSSQRLERIKRIFEPTYTYDRLSIELFRFLFVSSLDLFTAKKVLDRLRLPHRFSTKIFNNV